MTSTAGLRWEGESESDMQRSPIEWTHFTSNPIQYRDVATGKTVWACIHASPGCLHCYAEQLALRWHRGKLFNVANMREVEPFLDEAELQHIRIFKPAAGKMCFLGDMTDIFGEWISEDLLNQLFSNTLEMRENVIFQLLTKRAVRMHDYLSWRWGGGRIPMRNIWVGVSVESRQYLPRIDALRKTPAAVRFVSFEPLLEDVGPVNLEGIHWAIIGGESGPKSRGMNVAWVRSILRQCRRQNVRPFVKQMGSFVVDRNDAGWWGEEETHWPLNADGSDREFEELETGYQGAPVRVKLKDRKGGGMAEWPEDLRVREFPRS